MEEKQRSLKGELEERGLLQSRKINWNTFSSSFIGTELVEYLSTEGGISGEGDISARSKAIEFGETLLRAGRIVRCLRPPDDADASFESILEEPFCFADSSSPAVQTKEKESPVSPIGTREIPLAQRLGFNTELRVSIDKTETRSEGGRSFTVYIIHVRCENRRWSVSRRYRAFHALHGSLAHLLSVKLPAFPPKKLFGSLDPPFVNERRLGLQRYLRELVTIDDVWQSKALVLFLDDSSHSLGLQVKLQRFADHVAVVEERTLNMHLLITDLREVVTDQQTRILELEKRLSAIDSRETDGSSQVVGSSDSPDSAIGIPFSVIEKETSSSSKPFPRPFTSSVRAPVVSTAMVDAEGNSFGGMSFRSIGDSFLTTPRTTELLKYALPSDEDRTPKSVSTAGNPTWGGGLSVIQSEFMILDESLLPLKLSKEPIVDESDRLVSLLQPSEGALMYRRLVLLFVASLVRQSLGAQTFAIGTFPAHSFLPDQELSVSVFLCQGQEKLWSVKINRALCMAGEQPPIVEGNSIPLVMGQALTEAEKSQITILAKSVTNVSFVNTGGEEKRVKCVVDSLNVNIGANELDALCLTAFFEEIDEILGRKHLFKRSLVLVKGWCLYESRGFGGGRSVLGLIGETALSTLVLWVLLSNPEITCVFEALCHFFYMMERVDWKSQAISIVGLWPKAVLTQDVGRRQLVAAIDGSVVGKAVRRRCEIYVRWQEKHCQPAPLESSPTDAPWLLDPLNPKSNLLEGLKKSRGHKLEQLWRMGARSVVALLSSLKQEGNQTVVTWPSRNRSPQSVIHFKSLFSNSYARFKSNWRPDVPELTSPLRSDALLLPGFSTEDLLVGSLQRLTNNIEFCSFLLESEVTSQALLALTVQILSERGTLPVGEVGKLLQEATANPALSTVLKEKFGGLKKFFEKHGDVLLLSNDHPFNPHVFLRSTLSHQQVTDILSGATVSPAPKKKKRSRLKRTPPQSALRPQVASGAPQSGPLLRGSVSGGGGGFPTMQHTTPPGLPQRSKSDFVRPEGGRAPPRKNR